MAKLLLLSCTFCKSESYCLFIVSLVWSISSFHYMVVSLLSQHFWFCFHGLFKNSFFKIDRLARCNQRCVNKHSPALTGLKLSTLGVGGGRVSKEANIPGSLKVSGSEVYSQHLLASGTPIPQGLTPIWVTARV